MKYDPTRPDPSSEVLDKLTEEELFEWLDTKAEYLKSKTRPMNSHELKQVVGLSAAIDGRKISDDEWEAIKKQGKLNEEENNKRWQK
jgi:hypothetical protein